MKDPHEKGVANHSAPSFARYVARRAVKRKQGNRWAGYGAPKIRNQGADVLTTAEGHMTRGASASLGAALRSLRPQTRLDTFCTRTGRPPRCPAKWGPAGEGLRPDGPHARWGGVGQGYSTDEPIEQRRKIVGGGGGGKAPEQGEHSL